MIARVCVLILYLTGVWYWSGPPQDYLHTINHVSTPILEELVRTKYFKLIRLNLESECPLQHMNRVCRAEGCTVGRCHSDQIPPCWQDQVVGKMEKIDIWESERREGVWHVQDLENDKGQYFDIQANVQAYTGYNGSDIWKLIYEENCMEFSIQCRQNNSTNHFLYKLLSGLHTSISTQLCQFFTKNTPFPTHQYYFNQQEYHSRVLTHPDRINNLLFLYQLFLYVVVKVSRHFKDDFIIQSDNLHEDLKGTTLLKDLLNGLQQNSGQIGRELIYALRRENITNGKDIQPYIHNISRIINCVGCEKCRLFGKMQTYGIGTALKILFDQDRNKTNKMKRNQVVALFNTFAKISMSVKSYYEHRKESIVLPHMRSSALLINIWIVISGVIVAIMLCLGWIRANDSKRKKKTNATKSTNRIGDARGDNLDTSTKQE